MRLDEVVLGESDFRAVIDGIASSAADLISRLTQQTGIKVDLAPAAQRTRAGRSRGSPASAAVPMRKRTRGHARGKNSDGPGKIGIDPPLHEKIETGRQRSVSVQENARRPTPRMIAFARAIAKQKAIDLPRGCEQRFDTCRTFLAQNAGDSGRKPGPPGH
jgi:hypothetical protein